MEVDVVVVGGGPAGSSTATHLARSGHSVVIIDKAQFPRDKCCGDGLTTSALRQLEELGLQPKDIPSWRVVNETVWRSPSDYAIDLRVPTDNGIRIAVARRFELDAALLDIARNSGVTVLEGHGLESFDSSGSGVSVTTSGGETIDAKYAIGADGMWSPLRHMATGSAPGAYKGDIHAFRQYFKNVTGPAKDALWVSFEPDLLPGYVWSFPVGDGCANVGFGIERRNGITVQWMAKKWPELLQRPHIRAALGETAEPESPHKSWPIPASISPTTMSARGGRVLFVGDAARAVDPLTGEGIGQALETGKLAAIAITKAGLLAPAVAAKTYERSVKLGLYVDSRFSRSLANLVRKEIGARAVIRLAPAGPWKGQYALRWVFEDNPRAGLLTPWRWRDRFKQKTGAYK